NLVLLDVIEDRARTPALIRDRRWPEPAGAHELAATKLGQLAGQIPRHGMPSFDVTGAFRELLSLAYSGRRAPIPSSRPGDARTRSVHNTVKKAVPLLGAEKRDEDG